MMKRVVAALIVKDDLILACQRTRHQPMPLKWEFPGGKMEDGEQPRDAMRRELEEELGIVADVGVEVARIVHEYPGGGSGTFENADIRACDAERDAKPATQPGSLLKATEPKKASRSRYGIDPEAIAAGETSCQGAGRDLGGEPALPEAL